jgi:molybdate transport system permease protein
LSSPGSPTNTPFKVRSNTPFLVSFIVLGGSYVLLIGLMVLADFVFLMKPVENAAVVSRNVGVVHLASEAGQPVVYIKNEETGESRRYDIPEVRHVVVLDQQEIRKGIKLTDGETSGTDALYCSFVSPAIQDSIILSLVSCSISTILALIVAVPIGYIMSRFDFRGKNFIDTILDSPIVMPPLVIGISLLILFRFPPFDWAGEWIVFEKPAVILAQFAVAGAFAVRTMRVTFNQIPQRHEHVAMTAGCNRSGAFWRVIFPQARHGLLAAGTLAWARSLGEFGPILIFAGATHHHTEVLPTSVYFALTSGDTPGMLAISMIMIVAASIVLLTARAFGLRGGEL